MPHRSIPEGRDPAPGRAWRLSAGRTRTRTSRSLAAALAAGGFGLALAFSGCGLATTGLPLENVPPGCTSDAECADANLCTTTSCGADGQCVITPASGVTPDDANACTIDSCSGTTPTHEPLDDGTTCVEGQGTGTCQDGACSIACDPFNAADVCDDGQPCTVDDCDLVTARCVRTKLDGTPTPGVNPIAGDCRESVCLDGADNTVVDLVDVPPDAPCFDESCSEAGEPMSLPHAANTPCGDGSLVCDGAGTCVGCTEPAQCPTAFCNPAACVSSRCTGTPVGAGAPVPGQIPSDCQEIQCDGLGGEISVAADADVPLPDAFECTEDTCIQGSPQHPSLTQGTPCTEGGGAYCDGATSCVQCTTAGQCVNPGACADVACSGGACVVTNKQPGVACGAGSVCDGNGTCVGCTMSSDCADPGECVSPICQNNVCGVTNDAQNTTCSTGGTFCNGAGSCVECTDAAQCPDPGDCKVPGCTAGSCTPSDAPTGAACPGGVCATGQCVQCTTDLDCADPTKTCQIATFTCKLVAGRPCAGGAECASGFCADGVCCNSACTAQCASCDDADTNSADGMCAPITAGDDPDNECSNPPNFDCNGTTGQNSCG